jgi:hypothetical protein
MRLDDVHSIVVAHRRRWPFSESVEHTDGERFVSHSFDLFGVGLLELQHLIVESKVTTDHVAQEDQGDDSACHVLVHAG